MIQGGLEKIDSDDENVCDFKTYPKGCMSSKKTWFTNRAIKQRWDKRQSWKGEYESDDGGVSPISRRGPDNYDVKDPFTIKLIKKVKFTNKKGDLNVKVIEVESYKKFNFIDEQNHLCCLLF